MCLYVYVYVPSCMCTSQITCSSNSFWFTALIMAHVYLRACLKLKGGISNLFQSLLLTPGKLHFNF